MEDRLLSAIAVILSALLTLSSALIGIGRLLEPVSTIDRTIGLILSAACTTIGAIAFIEALKEIRQ